jgi:hypothetical protein
MWYRLQRTRHAAIITQYALVAEVCAVYKPRLTCEWLKSHMAHARPVVWIGYGVSRSYTIWGYVRVNSKLGKMK